MTSFLSVKEAALQVGKSVSAIRRAIHPITKDEQHPDRDYIKPSVAEARELRLSGVGFGWRISDEFLRKLIPADAGNRSSPGSSGKAMAGGTETELIHLLRQELAIKNQQITNQTELISKQLELVSGLSERLREGNVLMASLQQRLALTDGRDDREDKSSLVVDAKSATPMKPDKPEKPEKGSASTAKTAKSKKGLFARLFR